MPGIETAARFDFIRYANCWEDADILLKALRPREGDRCLSICSSGDNSLFLLTGHPRQVIAFDINPAQLACLELRKAAFLHFNHREVLEFLGVRPAADRWRRFEDIRGALPPEARHFWENQPDSIKAGVIHAGKFEKYFRLFRKIVLPLLHRKSTVTRLLSAKTAEAREAFYEEVWNNLNWRLLFRLFFSRFVMGRLGRDPEFFQYVTDNVAENILRRTRYALAVLPTETNPYLNFILTGRFPEEALPPYLRSEHFEVIRSNLTRLTVYRGDLKSCINAYQGIRFNAFNLSDIFEYMSEGEFQDHLALIAGASARGARIAYWNMMVDRLLPGNTAISTDDELSEKLFLEDRAFFYKRFIVGSMIR